MSSAALMIHSAQIRRNTPVVSATRQVSPAWTDLASDVSCLVQEEKTGGIRLGGAGSYLEYDAIGFFPADTDLRPRGPDDLGDQVIVNGTTWLCRLVIDESGMADHLVAYLKRFPGST
jgi:hypothetical protein